MLALLAPPFPRRDRTSVRPQPEVCSACFAFPFADARIVRVVPVRPCMALLEQPFVDELVAEVNVGHQPLVAILVNGLQSDFGATLQVLLERFARLGAARLVVFRCVDRVQSDLDWTRRETHCYGVAVDDPNHLAGEHRRRIAAVLTGHGLEHLARQRTVTRRPLSLLVALHPSPGTEPEESSGYNQPGPPRRPFARWLPTV